MKSRACLCSMCTVLVRRFPIALVAAFLMAIPLRSFGGEGDEWYAGILDAFVEAGYIQPREFGAAVPATRGAFLDLLLRLKGGVVHGPFAVATFDDVSADDLRFFTFEEAAAQGWVRGAGNCLGSYPCPVFPRRAINRAEAAAILVRSFNLTALSSAPVFRDTEEGAWYFEPLHIAAGHCIFRGDDGQGTTTVGLDRRGTVRPADTLNQAEMLAVLGRAIQGLSYPDCQAEWAPLPPAPASLQMQLPLPALPSDSTSSSSSVFPSVSSASSSSFSSFSSSLPSSIAPSAFSSSSVASVSSPAPSAVPSASPDSGYAAFVSKYDQYVALFGASLEATKTTENVVTVQALNLLKAQMDIIAAFYQYVAIARQRMLTEGERQVALSLMTTIEKGFANIQGIQSRSGSY